MQETRSQIILKQLRLNTNVDILFLERIEEHLLKSGLDIQLVSHLMNFLVKKTLSNKKKTTKEYAISVLKERLHIIANDILEPIDIDQDEGPHVILVCGVNGCGKTTTIGKMAHMLSNLGWDIVIASCDTYRAAAEEQLTIWTSVPRSLIITKKYDYEKPYQIAVRAYQEALITKKDLLIIDTSGRTPDDVNLMSELQKIKNKVVEISVRKKIDNILLMIDSNCGHVVKNQIQKFKEAVDINGLVLTKSDISQRPGSIISWCKKFNLPIHAIANGEGSTDLQDIELDDFIDMVLQGL